MITEKKREEIRVCVNNAQNTLLKNAGNPEKLEDKLDAIDIHKALAKLGYSVSEIDRIHADTYNAEAVGYLDKTTQTIYIKSSISSERKLFTLAHELGHILMHTNMDVMHREVSRPKGQYRPPLEEEADFFASCWLMPRLLFIKRFRERFLTSPLTITDNVAFHLSKNDSEKQDLVNATREEKYVETVLAKATSFNGKSFNSLAKTFKLSVDVTAKRIVELGLVNY